ncbi:MAG TPA: molybdopterin-dependent oxidoreductase [Burkholderiales bacterium]|jgi:anaerobic selenocysteine-containing dehydrogenase|nr:molybdopterin-dependent oxidoreductase [Burkholderiales bacterium]
MEPAPKNPAALSQRVVRATCPHDCPDSCAMLVTVDMRSRRAIRVEGDPGHPITRGYLCNKVNHYLDLVYNERRVLHPRRRVGPKGPGAKWQRITWDEALDEVAARLKAIIREHGPEAVLPFSYSGSIAILGFLGMGERFFNKMGACRLERTICTAAGVAAETFTNGRVGQANIEDLPQMEVVLLWGTNLVSTGVHAMPFVNEARANGAKIIAIDPRVTRTTAFADWHLQPRPGTDAALALGMMKIIVDRGLHDVEFLKGHTVGWEKLIDERLPQYPVERVARITGIKAEDIERLALLYGSTKRSFIRLNWGIQRHSNGGSMVRAIELLPVITGALCGKGGVCMSTGGEMRNVDLRKLQRPDLLAGRTPRTFNMIQLGKALNEAEPPVRALFVWNSDPANCVPDTRAARRGLSREDLFTVVHDTFFSDTADYADILLPADTTLERTDVIGAYGHFYFGLSLPAIDKIGESLDNNEMFRRLARKMGYDEPCFAQSDEDMIKELIDPAYNPLFEGVSWEMLKEKGWARAAVDSPRRPGINSGRWPTPSGKIEIYSERMAALGLDPLPAHLPETEGLESAPPAARYPLQVISAATHYFIGASFQHVPRLQEMMSRPTFEVSPQDAAARGIRNGDYCRLYNDRGEVFGHAVVVEGLLPGVVGTQKQLQGSRMPNGVNVNALVSQDEADMGRGPVFYSTLAQLEKVSRPDQGAQARH